jgi:hypothetical protein
MTRWLLNTFPTWVLAVIVIGGFVLIALGGLALVRRYLPAVRSGEGNEFASVMNGVIAAVYGVFLAFAIVALYEQFHEAQEGVRSEAAALARVVVNTEGLPAPQAVAMKGAVTGYRDTVIGEEWRAMEDGESADRAWEQMEDLYAVLNGFEPSGPKQETFYAASLDAVNELVDARRSRLHAAEAELPGAIMLLLFGGGVLTLAFTLIFGVPQPRMHMAMSIALAVLLGFALLVALILDYPFSGEVAVSTQPYFEDALREQ